MTTPLYGSEYTAEFSALLAENFGFEPTSSQEKLMYAMARFVVSTQDNCMLAVKGYAGDRKSVV